MRRLFAVFAALFILLPGQQARSAEKLVEIMLSDKLDEARGYCLDIAGGKGRRAPLDRGLQAHTCYHYTGGILEDQGFDAAAIGRGQFRLPYFNVCMTATAVTEGAAIALASCGQVETQKFSLKSNGQLVSQSNPKLCITVNGAEKREGRGGFPIHVMRPLSLQACDDAKRAFQTWALHSL